MYTAILDHYRSWPLIIQGIIVGLFLGSGFVFPALFTMGIIGVVLFLVTVVASSKVWRVLLFGVVAWSCKMLLVLSWGFSIYPIDWIATDSIVIQGFFILLYLLLSSFIVGLGGGICASVLFWIRLYVTRSVVLGLIMIPVTWLISEVMGAFLFSVFYLGPGITPNISFSFGYLGYLAGYWWFMLPLAKFGGVYALDVGYVFLAAVVYGYVHKKITLLQGGSAVLLLLLLVSLARYTRASSLDTTNSSSIAVVSTFFDSKFELMDEFGELKQQNLALAVTAANLLPVDYVILPEDSRYLQSEFGPELQGDNLLNAYRFTGGDDRKVLIDSSRIDTQPGEVVLRSFLLDGQQNQVFEFDKQYLVPQGEFMPYSMSYLFSLAGFSEAVALQAIDSAYRPGPKLQIGNIPSHIPAVLFCSEAVDPLGVAKIINGRSVPFVASPVSHAWFHNSKILSTQVDTMLRIQAVANSVYIVSAGNMEDSKVYTPNGRSLVGDTKATGDYWHVAVVSIP